MGNGQYHRVFCFWTALIIGGAFLFQGCTNPDKTIEKKLSDANDNITAGNYSEAIDILENLHNRHPDRVEPAEALAFALARNGQNNQAAYYFLETIRIDPTRTDLYLYAAQAYSEAGNTQSAIRQYEAHLTLTPDDFHSWRELGRLQAGRGYPREAIEAYLNSHRLRPDPVVANRLGELFLQVGNRAQAEDWLRTASTSDTEAGKRSLLLLAQFERQARDFPRLERRIAELDARFPGALDESPHAIIRTEVEQWRDAQNELDRIREEQARLAVQLEEERRAREEEEARLAEAEQEAAAAAEEDTPVAVAQTRADDRSASADETARNRLQEAGRLLDADRPSEAIPLLWQFLAHDPSPAEAWYDLSRSYHRLGNHEDATTTALEAIRREPDSQRYWLHYLNAARETLSARDYVRELENARRRFPTNADIVLALAYAHAASDHNRAQALQYYREFIRLDPAHPRRRDAERYFENLERR